MKLFACMCNQPQRLAAALAPVRAQLVAPPPVSRWGLGYIQGGDVLLVRTPKASARPVDLAGPLFEIATDCAIAQAQRDPAGATAAIPGGTDNTPPFRYRRWLFGQTGNLVLDEAATARLLEQIPEYLRRNIRGRSASELIFHVLLAMLHDEGHLDDPNVPVDATRRALAATLRLVTASAEPERGAVALGNVALTNGRSMVVARLEEPLRLRRLVIAAGERGRDLDRSGAEAFRGVLLVSGDDGAAPQGFEDVPAQHTVLISRDLKVTLADLAP